MKKITRPHFQTWLNLCENLHAFLNYVRQPKEIIKVSCLKCQENSKITLVSTHNTTKYTTFLHKV